MQWKKQISYSAILQEDALGGDRYMDAADYSVSVYLQGDDKHWAFSIYDGFGEDVMLELDSKDTDFDTAEEAMAAAEAAYIEMQKELDE